MSPRNWICAVVAIAGLVFPTTASYAAPVIDQAVESQRDGLGGAPGDEMAFPRALGKRPVGEVSTSRRSERVATYNVYVGNKRARSDVRRLARRSSLLFLQEVKWFRVKGALPRHWRVMQMKSRNPDRRSTALAWDRRVWKLGGDRGFRLGADTSRVNRWERWMVWAQLERRDNGRRITAVSVHYPLRTRAGSDQPKMHRAVRRLVREHRGWGPRLVAGDWNAPLRRDPGNLARKTEMRWRGSGVDGFLAMRRLGLSGAWAAGGMNSDHPAMVSRLGRRYR